MLSRVKYESGAALRLHNKDGRKATARVITCQPAGPDTAAWKLGAMLDRPENFWGLKECPKDWATGFVTFRPPQIVSAKSTPAAMQMPAHSAPATDVLPGRVARQIEGMTLRMIAESIRPLQSEITLLREKLERREANPSRFEVSLSSIPPELEQQIEIRLRKVLGPRVLNEAHQQSAEVLAGAKAEIEKRTTDCYDDFLNRVAEELKVVETRAQEISMRISANTQEHLRQAQEEFQQRLLDGGNSLKRLTEELMEFAQQTLNEEHNARRGDLEQLRASVSSESSRLHEHVEQLDRRIARMDESSRSLESGLTERLSQMASNTIKDARSQLDCVSKDIVEELTAHGIAKLGNQLDEATQNMKIVQKGIMASLSDSLKLQAADALQDLERSMQDLAQKAIERWRLTLERGLNAVTKSLGEQFGLEAESGNRGTPQ